MAVVFFMAVVCFFTFLPSISHDDLSFFSQPPVRRNSPPAANLLSPSTSMAQRVSLFYGSRVFHGGRVLFFLSFLPFLTTIFFPFHSEFLLVVDDNLTSSI